MEIDYLISSIDYGNLVSINVFLKNISYKEAIKNKNLN